MYREKLPSWLKHLDFLLLDLLGLVLAFILAYYLRMGKSIREMPADYRTLLGVMALIQVIASVYAQPYKGILRRGFYKEFGKCFQLVATVVVGTIFLLFAFKFSEEFSRLVVGYTAVLELLICFVLRIVWKFLLARTHVTIGRRSLMVVTNADHREDSLRNIDRETAFSYQVPAVVLMDSRGEPETAGRVKTLHGPEQLESFLREHWVDEVLIALPEGDPNWEVVQKKVLEMGLTAHLVLANHNQLVGKKQVIEKFGAYTVLTSSYNVVSPGQMLVKRVMDILGGLVGCIITALLTLIVGPVILIKSPGPIFFKQERVGRNGKKFMLYKFRSMCTDAEVQKKDLQSKNESKDGYLFKMKEDPRIIGSQILPDGTYKKGFGNFLRDTSLDEFPQFLNVLKGEMSLVGTRPPTVDEWEKYELHHHARLAAKPGITGLWQVSGRSNEMDFEKVVELDTQYIRTWSIGKDLKILLKTVKVVLKREGSA